TSSERIRDDQVLAGYEILGPFADEEEWQLAKWLIKNVGHNKTESFLKLPIITDRVKPSFDKKKTFLENIDSLPIAGRWHCERIPLVGGLTDENNDFKTEMAELWFRDPVESVKELIGNPAFKHAIDYAPTRLYDDPSGKEGSEVINEMSTARWWWRIQERLPDGSTAAPHKKKLSQFSGDKSAWPVYLTTGNINKDTRRKASAHARQCRVNARQCHGSRGIFTQPQRIHTINPKKNHRCRVISARLFRARGGGRTRLRF
ncbi:hypothetical protein C8R47DRAFT_988514, partial [Mycena vitilis]